MLPGVDIDLEIRMGQGDGECDELPPTGGEGIGFLSTESSSILYDRHNPRAWIEATATAADLLDDDDAE